MILCYHRKKMEKVLNRATEITEGSGRRLRKNTYTSQRAHPQRKAGENGSSAQALSASSFGPWSSVLCSQVRNTLFSVTFNPLKPRGPKCPFSFTSAPVLEWGVPGDQHLEFWAMSFPECCLTDFASWPVCRPRGAPLKETLGLGR